MEIVVLVIIGIVAGVPATLGYLEEHRHRNHALEIEFDALRSAQALSVKAWEAEQAMAEVAREYEADGGRG